MMKKTNKRKNTSLYLNNYCCWMVFFLQFSVFIFGSALERNISLKKKNSVTIINSSVDIYTTGSVFIYQSDSDFHIKPRSKSVGIQKKINVKKGKIFNAKTNLSVTKIVKVNSQKWKVTPFHKSSVFQHYYTKKNFIQGSSGKTLYAKTDNEQLRLSNVCTNKKKLLIKSSENLCRHLQDTYFVRPPPFIINHFSRLVSAFISIT